MATHILTRFRRILLMALAGLVLALVILGIARVALSMGPRFIAASMLLGGVYGWLRSTYTALPQREPRFNTARDDSRRVYIARHQDGPHAFPRCVVRRDSPIPVSIRWRMSRVGLTLPSIAAEEFGVE